MIFLISTTATYCQSIELIVNAENATQTLKFLNLRSSDTTEARKILSLEGTEGMLQHDSQFNKEMTSESFIKELTDTNSVSNVFGFKEIRNNLTTIRATIQLLEDSLNVINKRVEERLRKYCPEKSETINVYFVLGGNSDGFTDDNNSFYLEIQYYLDLEDIDGIISMVAHEVYHIIQERNFAHEIEKLKLRDTLQSVYMLIRNVYQEGSASLVGDPSSIKHPKGHSLFLQKKYKRNLLKLEESFYLFESLLLQSIENPNEDLLYGIAFGAQWDSPLYFVGYEICTQLERKKGEDAMIEYLSKSPTYFFMDYIHLYQSDSQVKYKFSTATEKALENIHDQMIK